MLLVFEIFRINLLLSTHSETNCSSLSVAIISVAVVADVYNVASGMSLVKNEKVRGLDSCPGEFLILRVCACVHACMRWRRA